MRKNYVYFMWDNVMNRVKIGQSYQPEKRLKEIQREIGHDLTILATIEDKPPLEFQLHQKFEQFRQDGEWFTPSADIMGYIKNNEGRPDLGRGLLTRIRTAARRIGPLTLAWLDDVSSLPVERTGIALGILLGIFGSLAIGAVLFVYGIQGVVIFAQTGNFNQLAGSAGLFVVSIALAIIPTAIWLAALTYYLKRARSDMFSDN